MPDDDFTTNEAPLGSDDMVTPWLVPPPAIVAQALVANVAAATIDSRSTRNMYSPVDTG
jgi:hypothetical protein